ncbi:GNAT family N-acetyltransferase [Qipengyuania seohaensis]|uniref:GNAT family N-acetyltransferase n=1 Tax=Qipengyuania seohaensis TaxID=266951 RepID=UPI000C2226CE|nr:GNAT family N-acetyltransferase [Qipengyuania seohaensis]
MSDTIEIQHEGSDTEGRYFTPVEGSSREAELTWRARGEVRHATHTFVPPEARGQGLAARLVKAMIEDARDQDFRIAPDCSYVEGYFKRHPELSDLRA